MISNSEPVRKRSRGVVLTEEALDLLDQELRKWWETSVAKEHSKTGILTWEQKGARLGLDWRTVHKIYHREPVDESVLSDAFKRLKIKPRFTRERYCVVAPSRSGNLPRSLTVCLGRETEVAAIVELLDAHSLVTLTGAGGVGKSRLAIEVAGASADNYPDGVWLVELAGVADRATVPQRVAVALGVQESRGPLMQTLTSFLHEKQLLLLLDNCEHLLDACATLAEHLLSACPDVKILVTSRECLHLLTEQSFYVPSLATPNPKEWTGKKGEASRIGEYAAVRLFAERAAQRPSGFTLTDENARTVASLCQRLDGIPLALELAAACHRTMPLDELEKRLNDRFHLLTRGSRTALPRHQTLRATMDWSYDLLETKQKALLGRLSVFVDGWLLEAAEQVCAGSGLEESEIWELLTALVEKSLVVYQEREGQARYHLLETVRQYGGERLAESGEKAAVQRRHRDYFLALAEEADPNLRVVYQESWWRRVEAEHGNFLAGLAWSLSEVEWGVTLRLLRVLCYFWRAWGYISEGRKWCARVLQASADCREWPLERAKLLRWAGGMAHDQSDYASAQAYYEESLALSREMGDLDGMATALNGLGGVATHQGNGASARLSYEESLALCREREDWNGVARVLTGLGALVYAQGDNEAARAYFEESLRISQRLGDGGKIATLLKNLGHVAQAYGDYGVARSYLEESLVLFRKMGHKRGTVAALSSLGLIAYFQGDEEGACVFLEEGIALAHEIGDLSHLAFMLNTLGRVAQAQGEKANALSYCFEALSIQRDLGGQHDLTLTLEALAYLVAGEGETERAAVLWGAAEVLREKIDFPLIRNERQAYEGAVAKARQAAGEEIFLAAWARGRSLAPEQAIEYALETSLTRGE